MTAHCLSNAKRLTLNAPVILTLFVTSYLLPLTIFAGSGLVSSIGGVTFVQGASQFWVTSSRPTFSGVTTAGEQVTGAVGSQTLTATADTSGNWFWTPTADLAGDNTVSITSGSQNVSFILTIGVLPEGIASASGGTLAPAGDYLPTIAILGFGGLLTTIGFFGFKRSFSKVQD